MAKKAHIPKTDLETWEGRIAFLRKQADQVYACNTASWTWSPNFLCLTTKFNTLAQALESIPATDFPNVHSNRTMLAIPQMTARLMKRMNDYLVDHGYGDVQFFDHGDYALVFRVLHRASGETQIARIEVDHHFRQPRYNHPTVLQPILTNQAAIADFQGIRIEVLPEILPLHKLPARRLDLSQEVSALLHKAIFAIGWATNKTYPDDTFDYDAEGQNVGVLPNGRVVTFDPEIIADKDAPGRRRRIEKQYPSLTPSLLSRLYGP